MAERYFIIDQDQSFYYFDSITVYISSYGIKINVFEL